MAWYALYKWFAPWRKTPYIDMIRMYKKYLYDEWYNGLTEEQKEKVKKYEERKEEKRKRDLYSHLSFMMAFVDAYKYPY